VVVDRQACRFFCGNPGCAKATFAEQVPGLTTRYGRRPCALQAVLQAVALALGSRAGARLPGRLACAVSRSTMVRRIRAAADPDQETTLVLGVDDVALRKGHVYGTIRHPDPPAGRQLPERSAESFRAWLEAPPGWRSSAGTAAGATPLEGAAQGAPLAIQVADRWQCAMRRLFVTESRGARGRRTLACAGGKC
jgi:hypothetical protein